MRRFPRLLRVASLCALSLTLFTAHAADKGERYAALPADCAESSGTAASNGNANGTSGFASASQMSAGNDAGNGSPDNGFPPERRSDAHGQQLAPPPAPAQSKSQNKTCTQPCDAGYVSETDSNQKMWCRRATAANIRLNAPEEIKPAGMGAAFNRYAKPPKLDEKKLAPWQGHVTVQVLDTNNQPVSGQTIKLTQTIEKDSGGHPAGKHKSPRPQAILMLGTKAITEDTGKVTAPLVTDAEGKVKLFISANEFAGIHRIEAECAKVNCGKDAREIRVMVPDLEQFEPTEGKSQLVGGSNEKHDERHYLSASSIDNLKVMIRGMNDAGWKNVGVNDAALVWGGKFDITGKWSGSHNDHGAGTAVDLRTHGVSLDTRAAIYNNLCNESKDKGALNNQLPKTRILWHDNEPEKQMYEHFHVYLIGTGPNAGALKPCEDKGGWLKKTEQQDKKTKKAADVSANKTPTASVVSKNPIAASIQPH